MGVAAIWGIVLISAFHCVAGEENSTKGATNYSYSSALKNQMHAEAELPQTGPLPETEKPDVLLLIGLLILGVGTAGHAAFRSFRLLNTRFNLWRPISATAADSAVELLAEDPTMKEFLRNLHGEGVAPALAAEVTGPEAEAAKKASLEAQLTEALSSARKQIKSIRKLASLIFNAPNDPGRQRTLKMLFDELRPLKDVVKLPALLPLLQLTSALEGFLKQLSEKELNVTPSSLRTLAAALDVLESLCVADLNPNLCMEPPVQLLAVDDDPISRRAISAALKKVFEAPELAPDGKAALRAHERKTIRRNFPGCGDAGNGRV